MDIEKIEHQEKPTLWYFADPMCSWCWGFSPVIKRLMAEYVPHQLMVALNLGGLRPGETEPLSADLRKDILHHWHEVHRLTGQEFLFEGAMPEAFVYNTEPPSRAVLTFSLLDEDRALDYFFQIQSAFYSQGLDITQKETLIHLAEGFDIDEGRFARLFDSVELHAVTAGHFQRARQIGVTGFPTLIWQDGENLELVCRGYVPFEKLVEKLEANIKSRNA